MVDGPGNFLPDDPLVLRSRDEYAQVPLMSGWNAEDGSLYVLACQYSPNIAILKLAIEVTTVRIDSCG